MILRNTLTNQKETFSPLSDEVVTIYTCGPTVYSEPHIGNWVAYIRWDTLIRTLNVSGYTIKRVMNITDVGHLTGENQGDADSGEDKMSKGARQEGITEWEVADRYTHRFLEGMTALNLLPPEFLAKATEHIDIQIDLVRQLESKGFTYILDDGVYFDTAKFPTYANFAHLDLAAQQAGARVAFNSNKRNNSDFVLWRLNPAGETRTMQWESPWGQGIPGWHIECSAMAMKYLGETIDIHTGGIDHIPVHHTNEIAQSEAATGKQFARYWLHNAHLLSDGTKLSKSLGNSYTLADIAERGYNPMDFRMFILQSHYRTETNFTWDNLAAAKQRLTRWRSVAALAWQTHDTLDDDDDKDDQHGINGKILAAPHAALEALQDDLNTPEALVAIERVMDEIDVTPLHNLQHSALQQMIQWIDDTLGLQLFISTPDISDDQKKRIIERRHARDHKDWGTSDTIRDELLAEGIILRDTAHHTIWSRT
ncbi:MAG: cysteine--tRNA ligase [Candidatus Saccharimonadales bacterium]